MSSNIEKYKKELESLIEQGDKLEFSMYNECKVEDFVKYLEERFPKKKGRDEFLKQLPNFRTKYQSWYSEALAVIKIVLPDRVEDFVRHYEKPKSRKSVEYGNYVIADYLQGLRTTRGWEEKVIVEPSAAIPEFQQQLSILKAATRKFESSLFDIQQLVQADLFDSELEASTNLQKNGFSRAAGAIAGVVLEKHLAQVCTNHQLSVGVKNPHIVDYNELLKKNDIIDIATWRFIQHLSDIRNLCDHNKSKEPTPEQVTDLITGVDKLSKTLF
jgi:hypothetical protein